MEEKNNSEKLIKYITKIATEATKATMINELKNANEELSKMIVDGYKQSQELLDKERTTRKRNMTDSILQKYLPLKKSIANMEENILTKEAMEKAEDKLAEQLMITQFKDVSSAFEETLDIYISIKQLWLFIDQAIKDYEDKLLTDNNTYNKLYQEKEPNARFLDTMERNKKKIYILENYYKEGKPVKEIKKIYDNERRFLYDKNELLDEMNDYFSGIHTVIDVFSDLKY